MTATAIALPGTVSDELIAELKLEFPRFSGPQFGEEKVRAQGRAFRKLADQLGTAEFCARVSEMVDIAELEPDPDFLGAGLRATREGNLPGWWHGRSRHGWFPRVGLFVNLTPSWRDPWTDGAGAALLANVALPEAVQVMAPSGAGEPCLALLATFYTRDPPHFDALPELPPEPGVVAPLLALPDSFGRDPARFESDLAALRQLVAAHGTALSGALQREAALVEHFMARVERPFWDGTTAMEEDERALVRCVLDGRTRLLEQLAAMEAGYRDGARALAATPQPPISGPAEIVRITGYWRDHWATSLVEVTLLPSERLRKLRIRGCVPDEVCSRQKLQANVAGAEFRTAAPPGDELVWELPITAEAGEPLTLRVSASHQWIPAHAGASPDPRPLAWLLLGLEVE
jgi:hypothetical protein